MIVAFLHTLVSYEASRKAPILFGQSARQQNPQSLVVLYIEPPGILDNRDCAILRQKHFPTSLFNLLFINNQKDFSDLLQVVYSIHNHILYQDSPRGSPSERTMGENRESVNRKGVLSLAD